MDKEFITYGFIIEPEKFNEPKNGRNFMINKPDGGLWASPVDSKDSWKDWCLAKNFRNPRSFGTYTKFKLKETSKIYTIDCREDFVRLLKLYGRKVPVLDEYFIDWEKVSRKYDGVYLTYDGNIECHHYGFGIDLNAWDVESIVVLRLDCIEILEKKKDPE